MKRISHYWVVSLETDGKLLCQYLTADEVRKLPNRDDVVIFEDTKMVKGYCNTTPFNFNKL